MSSPRAVEPSTFGLTHLAATVALLLALALAIVGSARPPAARGDDASAQEFSASRAMADVRGLTAGDAPHPIGSEDHARVRAYVEQRLRALGLEPTLQRARACAPRRDGTTFCAEVENVVARIDGREGAPALMLAAHYDSVPRGPGAGDDAAGVATILEIARAIRADGVPRRPIVLLLDDGEEAGLLGARAFVAEHPWARDVRVVLNFEARGNAGQTAMFETSEQSAWLVDVYGASVARPTAASILYALYKKLPNDTDLTVFKRAGMLGLNFAFAERVWEYHTADDNAARLDPRSVQHMGDQGLAVARVLSAGDLAHPADGEAVYFELFTRWLVRWPARLALPLALLVALGGAGALGAGWRRSAPRPVRIDRAAVGRVLGVTLAMVLALVAALAVGFLLDRAIVLRAGRPRPWASAPMAAWIAFGAGALAATSSVLVAARRLGSDREASAALVVLSGTLSLLVAATLPAGSYLFTLPALAAAVAHLAASPAQPAWRRWTAYAATLAVAALLWIPLDRVLLVMVGAEAHPSATLPVAILALFAAPILIGLEARARWRVAQVAGAACLLAVLFAG